MQREPQVTPDPVHAEGVIESCDGVRLFAQYWKPSGQIRGVVCIVHGGLEHTGRYAHVGKLLRGADYLVAAIDLRGHGRSAC